MKDGNGRVTSVMSLVGFITAKEFFLNRRVFSGALLGQETYGRTSGWSGHHHQIEWAKAEDIPPCTPPKRIHLEMGGDWEGKERKKTKAMGINQSGGKQNVLPPMSMYALGCLSILYDYCTVHLPFYAREKMECSEGPTVFVYFAFQSHVCSTWINQIQYNGKHIVCLLSATCPSLALPCLSSVTTKSVTFICMYT